MKDVTKWLIKMLVGKLQLKQWVFWLVASIIGGILWGLGNYNESCGGCLPWSVTVMSIGSYIMGLLVQLKPDDEAPLPPSK